MPVIAFSVPKHIYEKIKDQATEDETENLTAKRLLLGLLDMGGTIEPLDNNELEKLETQEVTPIAPDALEEIRDRLTELEESIGMSADDLDRLTEEIKGRILDESLKPFGDRLNQLETGQPELHETMTNLVERLEKLEGWISSLRDDRALAKGSLGKFSDRLDALEKGKVETAPREIPKGLTHKEMSLICGDAPSVLGKLAKNRDRWPEGYMWSEESKKWFPLEMPTDAIKTAKGLNHQEMAEICGVSLFEVTKLIHDSSKWPEGYMWSDESKKWFPMEV